MNKFDNMNDYNTHKSREKYELFKFELEKMFRNKEKISVSELKNRTNFSRSYFYNNKAARELIDLYIQKQKPYQRKLMKEPSESIINALKTRNKLLEKELKNLISVEEYDRLVQENNKLKEEVKALSNKLYLKRWNNI